VDLGVQGLHPAVKHLGKPGDLLNHGHGNAGLLQVLGRTAGGDDLDAELVHQGTGKVGDTGLVIHRNQGALNLECVHGGSS